MEAKSDYGSFSDNDDEQLARSIEESLKISKQRSSSRSRSAAPQNLLVCEVCHMDSARRHPTMFGKLEFWNHVYCLEHQVDGTPICTGCRRLQPKDLPFLNLGDGRHVCSYCETTITLDTEELESISRCCHNFFHGLDMEFKVDVPVYLVDQVEMGRIGSPPIGQNYVVRGLTWLAGYCGAKFLGITSSIRIGNNIKVKACHKKEKGLGIAILFGMPRIITGGILAHEMMHAWLFLQGVENLNPKIEEGICQVMAHKYLDWYESTELGSSSEATEETQYLKNLIQTFKHRVETSSHYAYGGGFREVQWAVARYGLKKTIKSICRKGRLPGEDETSKSEACYIFIIIFICTKIRFLFYYQCLILSIMLLLSK